MARKVEIYTWSYCPYCIDAKELLESKGREYEEHVLDNDAAKKEELTKSTGQDTVPYIFIDDELIGGYTELRQMEDEGRL